MPSVSSPAWKPSTSQRNGRHRHDHAEPARRRRTRSTASMWDELLADVPRDRARQRRSRVVVITGAGGDFCSGADLSGGGAERPRTRISWPRCATSATSRWRCIACRSRPSPRCAASPSAPGATSRSAAISSWPARTPASRRSSPSAACRSTSAAAGCCPAASACTAPRSSRSSADIIDAAEAERIGLVNRVVDDAELDAFVDDWATRLAAAPPIAAGDDQADAEQLDAHVTMEQALDDEGAVADGQLRHRRTPPRRWRRSSRSASPSFQGR